MDEDDNMQELIVSLFGKSLTEMTVNEARQAREEIEKELERRGYVAGDHE